MATHDLMYDSDAHVYMSRINPDSPDLTEDSDLPEDCDLSSSPVAQPSVEAPNFVPVLPVCFLCSRSSSKFKPSSEILLETSTSSSKRGLYT